MSILKRIVKIKDALIPLLFVPRCASCLTVIPSVKEALCDKCKVAYELESKLFCSVCGRAHRQCSCKINHDGRSYAFVHVTAYDIKRNSVSKNIILNIKGTRFPGAFDFLANEMYNAMKERYVTLFDNGNVVITYVPRSDSAQKKAGHDQSHEIAKRVSALCGAQFITAFENLSQNQQKKLDAAKRRENAKKNYVLADKNINFSNKVVVIIDDIVTTGSSIGACADLAKKAKAKAVIGLVCARADSNKSVDNNSYIVIGE